MQNQVTLLVHGPISIYTLMTMYRFGGEYPMVFVLPRPLADQDAQQKLLEELYRLIATSSQKTNIIVYTIDVPATVDNTQNRYLHFFSVVAGLGLCTTPFTVKIRSDEFYTNLTPFFDAVYNHPKKIITNDVFFRNGTCLPFHPSDHLIGGQTSTLHKVFQLAKTYCEHPEMFKETSLAKTHNISDSKRPLAAEQLLGVASIAIVADTIDNPVSAMQEVFHIVSVSQLGFFRVAYNSAKEPTEYFTRVFFEGETDIDNITSYTHGN
jgi:hypothetical protein